MKDVTVVQGCAAAPASMVVTERLALSSDGRLQRQGQQCLNLLQTSVLSLPLGG